MKIVLGSSNPHKVKEINEIVRDCLPLLERGATHVGNFADNCQTPSPHEGEGWGEGFNIEFILPPDGFDPDERGKSFAENALIKAKAAWELSHDWSLADDSGLCIDALDGKPGIYSARYAETPQKRIERVLKELDGVENRKAHFICHMTLINPKGEVALSCEGICRGTIINEAKGVNGFGYDPIFMPEGYDKTIAELPEDEKNRISHRFKALTEVINFLQTI